MHKYALKSEITDILDTKWQNPLHILLYLTVCAICVIKAQAWIASAVASKMSA